MKPLRHLTAFDGSEPCLIATEKIHFIEAWRDCLQINSEGRGFLSKQRLAQVESQLDPGAFVRIDRRYLLNLACIDSVGQAGNGHQAMLDDGSCVPMSQRAFRKLQVLIGGR
jgi:two-component system, LytTR family, response regulator